MKKFMPWALAAICSAPAFGANVPATAEPVSILSPAAYASEAPAPDWIRQECHLEQRVVDDLHATLENRGMGGAVVERAGDGLVLKLTIERVIGQRGGGWSGPKTLTLGVALLRAGIVERTTSQSIAAKSINPLAGTCASFERASSKLSGLIARWVQPDKPSGNAAASAPRPAAAISSSTD